MRGITIAGMILVNNPGDWKYVYAPLRHAPWHGWTSTDLVFPFFLFIVGVSLSFSLSRRREQEVSLFPLYTKIIRRSILIFVLGIFLALIPRFDLTTLRIPGVLQRIALCYLFSSFLFLNVGKKGRAFVAFSLLIMYWLAMKLVPVPGYGAGVLEYQGNLCAYIDSQLLSGHLYKPGFDPEGILSTIPAISTTLLGTLTGDWLRSSLGKNKKMIGLFVGGLSLAFAGLVLHPFFPINKQLWTSTYVLFTAGAGLLILGICYSLMDVIGWKGWAFPFLVFGTNAIFVYVSSSLMAKLIPMVKIPINGHSVSLKTYIYSQFLVPLAGQVNGSLIYPVCLILFWMAIMIPLYRKNIYIKI
jgi:predicted acyltransferase